MLSMLFKQCVTSIVHVAPGAFFTSGTSSRSCRAASMPSLIQTNDSPAMASCLSGTGHEQDCFEPEFNEHPIGAQMVPTQCYTVCSWWLLVMPLSFGCLGFSAGCLLVRRKSENGQASVVD